MNIYLSNTIALKDLPPGEYDLEIILHDEIGKGVRRDPAQDAEVPRRRVGRDARSRVEGRFPISPRVGGQLVARVELC